MDLSAVLNPDPDHANITISVVAPHHIDADPDTDPDSTYHPDADPDSDIYLMRIRIFYLLWMRIQNLDPTFN